MSRQQSDEKWFRRINQLVLPWRRHNLGLGAKMASIVIVGTLALVSLFAYLGTTALNENIQRSQNERVILAQTTARHIDLALAGIEDALLDAALQGNWADPARQDADLAHAVRRLDFYATQVFLLNRTGQLVAARPPATAPISFDEFASVTAVLRGQPFAVSRFQRSLGGLEPTTLAATPLRDANSNLIGALVISINLANPQIASFTRPIGLGETGYLDLIDLGSNILASTRKERIGSLSDHGNTLAVLISEHRPAVSACHDCHTPGTTLKPRSEVLAFAPLEHAQWGITIRQSEDEVFGPIRQLQLRIFALMAIMLTGALMLVYLTTRSVIAPVQALTVATKRIAGGDLDTPLGIQSHDEVGTLAASFDVMRLQIKTSIAKIQAWNRELDTRVSERTADVEQAKRKIAALYAELQHKEHLRGELLRRILTAQEEERKRISRELHDETCQVLAGLAYALDDAADTAPTPEIKSQLERMYDLANLAVEEIQRIILDLRPTMLDLLGLVPALRWYAESRLNGGAPQFVLREIGEPRRLSPSGETALFRVIQEALNNIARHANAQHAELVLEYLPDRLSVTITDDGIGFDSDKVLNDTDTNRAIGLMGMRERMDAIDGELNLRSACGEGTVLKLCVPLDTATGEHTHVSNDSSPAR